MGLELEPVVLRTRMSPEMIVLQVGDVLAFHKYQMQASAVNQVIEIISLTCLISTLEGKEVSPS